MHRSLLAALPLILLPALVACPGDDGREPDGGDELGSSTGGSGSGSAATTC